MGELKATSAKTFKLFTLICLILLLYSMFSALVKANPDPVNVSWYVTDVSGVPIDEAALTIYWSTSTGEPFTIMPADDEAGTYIDDKIAKVRQNPIHTGYWNPTYPHGMAVCDVHPKQGVEGLYFYVKIEYDSEVKYWPLENSYKPGDPDWQPVPASGSPSGYAAAGPGIGTGPTTAYPTELPPSQVIPEVPLGPALAAVSMTVAIGAYIGMRKRKTPYIS